MARGRNGSRVGLLAIVLLGIGIFLGNRFRGIGPGGENTGVKSDPSAATETVDIDGNVRVQAPDGAVSMVEPMRDDREITRTPRDAVINVLIEDRTYKQVRTVDGEQVYESVDLPELMDRINRATGNADGVVVRIARKRSARATAEQDLDEALVKEGIAPDAIQRRAEFVE